MSISEPAQDLARRTNQQWILTALGAGGMMTGLAIFFFAPQDWYFIVLAAALFAVGLAIGLVALLRAVRMIGEDGPLRTLGFLSVLILVADPVLMTIIGLTV